LKIEVKVEPPNCPAVRVPECPTAMEPHNSTTCGGAHCDMGVGRKKETITEIETETETHTDHTQMKLLPPPNGASHTVKPLEIGYAIYTAGL